MSHYRQCRTLRPADILEKLGHHHVHPNVFTVPDLIYVLNHTLWQDLRIMIHFQVSSVQKSCTSTHQGITKLDRCSSMLPVWSIMVLAIRLLDVHAVLVAHDTLPKLLLGVMHGGKEQLINR